MIDTAAIYVKAGDGGRGCNSFKGRKFTRSYHPDGGDGGRGADVVIRVEDNIRSLEHLRFKQHFRAERGKLGRANKKKGADARPCIIKVPVGTIIRDLKDNLLLRDLVEPGEELMAAKGGLGGKANTKTKAATEGLAGEEKGLSLELKIVADIGIIGYPNAGKSTLLCRISCARPKIAAYPFTTLFPFLAMIEFADFEEPSHLSIVEIPALIKDSHQGKGLGAQFLRHAERCKLLIHLIDMGTQQGQDPLQSYHDLNQELRVYNQRLFHRPQILLANKMDLPGSQTNLQRFSAKVKKNVQPICAKSGEGIEELLNHLRNYFR